MTNCCTEPVWRSPSSRSRNFKSRSMSWNYSSNPCTNSSKVSYANTSCRLEAYARHQVKASPLRYDTRNRQALASLPKPTVSMYYRISKMKFDKSVCLPLKVEGFSIFTSRGTNEGVPRMVDSPSGFPTSAGAGYVKPKESGVWMDSNGG